MNKQTYLLIIISATILLLVAIFVFLKPSTKLQQQNTPQIAAPTPATKIAPTTFPTVSKPQPTAAIPKL